MKKRYINAFILVIVILVVGFFVLHISQKLMYGHHCNHGGENHSYDMHNILHNQLNLTSEQDKKLTEIEQIFRERRQYFEESIRLANMELANAIRKDASYSEQVQQAVDKIHNAMGKLQKASLEHLFAMKPILNLEQNKKLQQLITNALYENAKK